jgi:hypothetical protein
MALAQSLEEVFNRILEPRTRKGERPQGNHHLDRLETLADPSLTGIGEVVLLPLDVLKIKMQTNPDALRGRGFFKLITDEGIASLYRGWGWTMARNAPGSFAVGSIVMPSFFPLPLHHRTSNLD